VNTTPDETTRSDAIPAAMARGNDRPELSVEELRVLGSLVEKELTTPDQYPLTLNALVLACNQKSNREPVLDLDESTVSAAVTTSKTKGLVRFVHPSHGRSVLRYAHIMGDALDLSERQLALLAVLLLRGPQTLGELRARTERMTTFEDLDDLERELVRMNGLDPPVVERLARRPGQKEERYAHLLGAEAPDVATWGGEARASAPLDSSPSHQTRPAQLDLGRQLEELRADIVALKEELADLRRRLGD